MDETIAILFSPSSEESTGGHFQVKCCGGDLSREWDDYVLRQPTGTLFHLTAWKRAMERAFGYEPRYLVAESGGQISAVLPLFLASNPITGRTLISSPFAVYGGVCAADQRAGGLLLLRAREMARELGVQYLELRDREVPIDAEGFHTKQLYVTFDQELPRDADALMKGFPRDTRYMIRKGQKAGLKAVVGNDQLNTFYELYAESVRQLGTPVFSKEYFRILCEEFGDKLEITVIWQEAKAVAAVLSFLFRDTVLPYYGGSGAEGRKVAANNFMYWEVMRSALERGFRYFDFGRSKVNTGAYQFKMQWNMRERALPYQFYLVRRKDMPNFSPTNAKFKLAISVWQHLPLGLTKVIGPPLVRLFP